MGYWGYPWANGLNGSPWGYPGYGAPWGNPGFMPVAGMPPQAGDTFASHQGGEQPHKQKTGGITGFFKGIAQGAVNTVKGIFTPQGILMLAGTAALTWLTAGAILPLLGAIGIGVGGYQIAKGIADGDTEKIGEGTFSLGLSTLGFAGPKTVTVGGAKYALTPKGSGTGSGFWARMKAPFGGSRYKKLNPDGTLVDGKGQTMYQLSWAKMKERFAAMKKPKPVRKGGWFHWGGHKTESAPVQQTSISGTPVKKPVDTLSTQTDPITTSVSQVTTMPKPKPPFRAKWDRTVKDQLKDIRNKDKSALTSEDKALMQERLAYLQGRTKMGRFFKRKGTPDRQEIDRYTELLKTSDPSDVSLHTSSLVHTGDVTPKPEPTVAKPSVRAKWDRSVKDELADLRYREPGNLSPDETALVQERLAYLQNRSKAGAFFKGKRTPDQQEIIAYKKLLEQPIETDSVTHSSSLGNDLSESLLGGSPKPKYKGWDRSSNRTSSIIDESSDVPYTLMDDTPKPKPTVVKPSKWDSTVKDQLKDIRNKDKSALTLEDRALMQERLAYLQNRSKVGAFFKGKRTPDQQEIARYKELLGESDVSLHSRSLGNDLSESLLGGTSKSKYKGLDHSSRRISSLPYTLMDDSPKLKATVAKPPVRAKWDSTVKDQLKDIRNKDKSALTLEDRALMQERLAYLQNRSKAGAFFKGKRTPDQQEIARYKELLEKKPTGRALDFVEGMEGI